MFTRDEAHIVCAYKSCFDWMKTSRICLTMVHTAFEEGVGAECQFLLLLFSLLALLLFFLLVCSSSSSSSRRSTVVVDVFFFQSNFFPVEC